jgi:hypothetical protein
MWKYAPFKELFMRSSGGMIYSEVMYTASSEKEMWSYTVSYKTL